MCYRKDEGTILEAGGFALRFLSVFFPTRRRLQRRDHDSTAGFLRK